MAAPTTSANVNEENGKEKTKSCEEPAVGWAWALVMRRVDMDELIKLAEVEPAFAQEAYKVIVETWEKMEDNEQEITMLLKRLNINLDNHVESGRWDDVTELRDKLHDGVDVLQEVEEYHINYLDRVKLEGELVKRMLSAREDLVRALQLNKWRETGKDENLVEAENQRLRFLIQHLDRSYWHYYNTLLAIYVRE